jgi:hypothetical protein
MIRRLTGRDAPGPHENLPAYEDVVMTVRHLAATSTTKANRTPIQRLVQETGRDHEPQDRAGNHDDRRDHQGERHQESGRD